jgi:copper chaperone CopZ
MQTKTVTIPAISCGHCTRTIEMELGELTGVAAVSADVATKQVAISWGDPADWPQIEALLHEIGFPPQQLIQLN